MHRLMQLPEMFATLRAGLSLIAVGLRNAQDSAWMSIVLLAVVLLFAAGNYIAYGCDMLTARGRRFVAWADLAVLLVLLFTLRRRALPALCAMLAIAAIGAARGKSKSA